MAVSILSPEKVKGVRDYLISKATTPGFAQEGLKPRREEPTMAVLRTELQVVDTDIKALLVLVFSKDAAAVAAAE